MQHQPKFGDKTIKSQFGFIKLQNNYMQGQALRLRLSQLKKASIQLKSKVLNENRIDFQAVSDILSSIMPQTNANLVSSNHYSSNQSVIGQTPKKTSNHGIQSSHSNSLIYSPLSSMFVTPTSSLPLVPGVSKTAPQKLAANQRSSSHQSLHDNVDNEIQRLKRQNQDLENQISNISDELFDLRKKQKALQEEQWKNNLPFLYRKGQVGVFITRLFVKEYDYDKIDYEIAKTEIVQDRLLIQLPPKPCRDYKLAHLAEVKYVGQKVIKIDFKIDETIFLFLQFQSAEERQSWDLAIFVNQKIITSKQLDRSLFNQTKQKSDKQDPTLTPHFSKKTKSKSSLRFMDGFDQRNIDPRYLQSKTQKIRKNSFKSMAEKKVDRSIISKGSQNSQNKQDQSSRYINQFEYTLNGNNESLTNTRNGRESVLANSENQKQLQNLMVFGLVGDSHNQSRAHTSKFNLGEANHQAEDFTSPNALPEQSIYNNLKPPSDQAQGWQSILHRLKSGYFFTKYAKDGIKPHNKHIFISQEQDMLCCLDTLNRNQRRDIRIENIKKVRYPSIDAGIKKFLGNPKMDNFCVIQYTLNGQNKYMELGCQKSKFIERFTKEIIQFLRKKGTLISD